VCGCNRPENDVQIGRDGVLGAWDWRPNFALAIIRHHTFHIHTTEDLHAEV
jgi:hypothetical protein